MDLKRKSPFDMNPGSTKAQRVEENLREFEGLKALMEMAPEEVGSTDAEFQAHFDKIAALLFSSAALVVNNTHRFRLVEIEFYLKGGEHQDIFAHCDKAQLTCGEWYFHKTGNAYRSGNYKGLDITFGAKDKCHGGILIRGVQTSNDPSANIIEGPCLVVDQVLKLTAMGKINDLVADKSFSKSVFAEDSILRLAPIKQNVVRDVIKTPRVGLTLRVSTKERVQYVMQDYRYLIIPEQMTKGKPHAILSLYRRGKTSQEIGDITKTKTPHVKRYLELYDTNTHPVEFFAGKELSTDLLCQLFAAIYKKAPSTVAQPEPSSDK